jgi:Holliday junction resolvase RusA-like endonuclease
MAQQAMAEVLPRVRFDVIGAPAPQGSKTAIMTKTGKVVLVEGRRSSGRQLHAAWRGAVAEAAADARADAGLAGPMDGPLHLTVAFRLPMPASRPKHRRLAKIGWHTTRPDLTKLLRATEDAMKQGGLIADDARICHLTVAKYEVIGWTGASVTVEAAVSDAVPT